MTAGLLFHHERYEMRLEQTATQSRTHTANQGTTESASASTQYDDGGPTLAGGFLMSCSTTYGLGDVVGSATVSVSCPALGLLGGVAYASHQASLSASIEIDDLKGYVLAEQVYGIQWSAIRLLVNGVTVDSMGASSITSMLGLPLTEARIPLLGVPLSASPGAAVLPAPAVGPPSASTTVSNLTVSAQCDIIAGYRAKKPGGSYLSYPVLLDPLDPGGSCTCAVPLEYPEGTDSWTITASAYHYSSLVTTVERRTITECSNGPITNPAYYFIVDVYTTDKTVISKAASVESITTDQSKEFVCLNEDDYRAMIIRGGLPYARANATWSCQHEFDGETETGTTTSEPFESFTSMLNTVTAGDHYIFDPLARSTPCPYAARTSKEHGVAYALDVIQVGACPVVDPEEPPGEPVDYPDPSDSYCYSVQASSYPEVEDVTTNSYLLSYLYHPASIARYVNYCLSPFWSYGLYFPINTIDTDGDGQADAQTIWEVFSDRISNLYWLTGRQQYNYHSQLPVSEVTYSRNHILTEPLTRGQLASMVQDSIWGSRTSWPGVCRFQAQSGVALDSVTLNSGSSAAWSAENCSPSFGASAITITPTAGHTSDLAVEYDIGRWTEEPYQLPHIAKTITADWAGANISSVRVYLVNQAGVKALIGTVPGTYNRIDADDTKYAGSWAQEWGMGFVTDTGADRLGHGVSAATIANVEKGQAFQLHRGLTAAKLRFEFVTLNDTDAFTLEYPTFTMPVGAGKVLYENGQFLALYWPNAPGIRFGQRYWFDGATLQSTPVLADAGSNTMTVVDWLCEKRAVFAGTDPTSGIATELATLYDSVEGQTSLLADNGTLAVITKLSGDLGTDEGNVVCRAMLINSLSEIPPLSGFPMLERDRSTLELTTGTDCELAVFSLIQGPSRILSGRLATHLEHPSTRARLTSNDGSYSVPSWFVTSMEPALDNNEALHRIVRADLIGGDYADFRPWRGAMSVLDNGAVITPGASCPANCGDPWGNYHAVDIRDGDVWYRRADFGAILPGFVVTTQVTDVADAVRPRVAVDTNRRVYVIYGRNGTGNTYTRFSDDDGSTWSDEAVSFTGGTEPDIMGYRTGHMVKFCATGGSAPYTLEAMVMGPGDADFGASFTVLDDLGNEILLEETGFRVCEVHDGQMSIMLHALLYGEAAPSHWQSTDWDKGDEMTFKRIS